MCTWTHNRQQQELRSWFGCPSFNCRLSLPPAPQSGRGVYFGPDKGCKASSDKSELPNWSSGKSDPNLSTHCRRPSKPRMKVQSGPQLMECLWHLGHGPGFLSMCGSCWKCCWSSYPQRVVDHTWEPFTTGKSPRSTKRRISALRNWGGRMTHCTPERKLWRSGRIKVKE